MHESDQPAGRILGLDVGDRRVGVAVSDELGLTAQPVLTLVRKNRRADLGSLARLVRKYGCARVVVGNPLYMSGDVSPQALKAQDLAHALQLHTGVEVTLWDERLSTTEAHRHLDAAGRIPSRPARRDRSGGRRAHPAEFPRLPPYRERLPGECPSYNRLLLRWTRLSGRRLRVAYPQK